MSLIYTINPVKMGGLVKEVAKNADCVKIHLHGRLGVLEVPRRMILSDEPVLPGNELEFYFSYIQIVNEPQQYDDSSITVYHEFSPCLIGGTLTEVNDTAGKVKLMDGLGYAAVPRRWLFTDVALKEGLNCELYISPMKRYEEGPAASFLQSKNLK